MTEVCVVVDCGCGKNPKTWLDYPKNINGVLLEYSSIALSEFNVNLAIQITLERRVILIPND